MDTSLKLISTDFDGTLFAEFEDPPVPEKLRELITDLQAQGAKWVINTGRDMSSLMETLGRANIGVEPDYLVLVEREIHLLQESQYVGLTEWNKACSRDHEELFARVKQDVPKIIEWIKARFHGCLLYDDVFSPFCMIASNTGDADAIHEHLKEYCQTVPHLEVVRNDVYARFCHSGYNKGTALAEVTRRLHLTPEYVFAVGDHLNDLPMLHPRFARCLAAPVNAVPPVKAAVHAHGGYVSTLPLGHGVADALEHFLMQTKAG